MGFLLVFLLPEDPTDPFEIAWEKAASESPGHAWLSKLDFIFMPIQYIASVALFASGVGLLLWKPWARKVTIGVCLYALLDLVLNVPGIVLEGIVPMMKLAADPAYLASEGISEAGSTAFGLFILIVVTVIILSFLVFMIGQLVILNRPRVVAAFAAAGQVQPPWATSKPVMAVSKLAGPVRIPSQTLPQDGTDLVQTAALAPIVIAIIFMIPGILSYLIAIGAGTNRGRFSMLIGHVRGPGGHDHIVRGSGLGIGSKRDD